MSFSLFRKSHAFGHCLKTAILRLLVGPAPRHPQDPSLPRILHTLTGCVARVCSLSPIALTIAGFLAIGRGLRFGSGARGAAAPGPPVAVHGGRGGGGAARPRPRPPERPPRPHPGVRCLVPGVAPGPPSCSPVDRLRPPGRPLVSGRIHQRHRQVPVVTQGTRCALSSSLSDQTHGERPHGPLRPPRPSARPVPADRGRRAAGPLHPARPGPRRPLRRGGPHGRGGPHDARRGLRRRPPAAPLRPQISESGIRVLRPPWLRGRSLPAGGAAARDCQDPSRDGHLAPLDPKSVEVALIKVRRRRSPLLILFSADLMTWSAPPLQRRR